MIRSPIKTLITGWLHKEKQKVNASTALVVLNAAKSFLTFLKELPDTEKIAPAPGTLHYSAYNDWTKCIDDTKDTFTHTSRKVSKERQNEAEVNKRIRLTLDNTEREEAEDAIGNIGKNQFFLDTLEKTKEVNLSDPKIDEFTTETYNDVLEVLSIILITTSGHRPEVLSFITNDDVKNITKNTYNTELYTLTINTFSPIKRGKTRVELRISLDEVTYQLMTRFCAMKKALGIQTKEFLVDINNRTMTGDRLRSSASWKLLQIPRTWTFVKQRAEVSTFYRNNPETSAIDPTILLAHQRTMQNGPYAVRNKELFDKSSATLREMGKVPKMNVKTQEERQELDEKSKENFAKLTRKLTVTRSEIKGRAARLKHQGTDANYSITRDVKLLLFRCIFELRDPFFTYSLLTHVPKDSASIKFKPWTVLVTKFFLNEKNEDLLKSLLDVRPEKRVDLYTVTKQVKNTLVAYNRSRKMFPGFSEEPRKILMLKGCEEQRSPSQESRPTLKEDKNPTIPAKVTETVQSQPISPTPSSSSTSTITHSSLNLLTTYSSPDEKDETPLRKSSMWPRKSLFGDEGWTSDDSFSTDDPTPRSPREKRKVSRNPSTEDYSQISGIEPLEKTPWDDDDDDDIKDPDYSPDPV